DSKDPVIKNYYLSRFQKAHTSCFTSLHKRIRHKILKGVTPKKSINKHICSIISFAQINLCIHDPTRPDTPESRRKDLPSRIFNAESKSEHVCHWSNFRRSS